ncbi:uncharacterized protein J7T54_006639 [Emericellopsis cladophorae]|uniref:Calcineurin-like phosphoesterase domain-containing protein n=1 Tax=Emericellopsis cladophorae TaxID=2686198 RepID=A0A9Q0BHN5_9HYPO|nr:uncharacterized protein J7T54_006639 [Emericellopsis cladophorae]KAI6784594.1 hypothetical protein J7T54_006639 [Emericellopsis cladophorae]
MAVATFLRRGFCLVLPLALACSIWLYLYPVFKGCAFPIASRDAIEAFQETKKLHWPYAEPDNELPTALAPFRLLALGDPQLEGDTSIPIKTFGFLPHLKKIAKNVAFRSKHSSLRERIRMTLHDTVDFYFEDIPNVLESIRKVIDHFCNDFYLAHIYRTVHWWTRPTHVTVLGDLVGSQWIDNAEFERRGRRFWNRTFSGAERVPDEVALFPQREYDVSGVLSNSVESGVWTRRILNVVGNHDVGYAGDLTEERMERFERVFGKANYELRFELPVTDPELNKTIVDDETNPESLRLRPEIRIVLLNDMNLDTPAKSSVLQDATYSYVNAIIGNSHAVEFQGGFTIILTHIPTYKPKGICVDAPYFDFYPSSEGGGVREQYLLSPDASKGFFEGILGVSGNTNADGKGLGRPGVILNGHDHAGCDTYHFINQTNGTTQADRSWEHITWEDAQAQEIPAMPGHPGRREITVRSMMGGFGGNAGLLSLWFDWEAWEWRFEYADCALGTQHFWWFTHIVDVIVIALAVAFLGVRGLEANGVNVDKRACALVAFLRKRNNELWTRGTKTTAQASGTPKAA